MPDEEQPAPSPPDDDLPPWANRMIEITVGVFFVTVMGSAIALIVVGTIAAIRALL